MPGRAIIRDWRASLRRLILARAGTASIEFAVILPLMLLLYLGSAQLAQALMANRLVALTATTVTNLVAQYTTISASTQMPDILGASAQVLAPYPVAQATVVISSIAIDAQGKATIAWSQTLNGSARASGSVMSLPAALDVPGTTILLGEVTYAFAPTLDYLKLGSLTLASSVYMLPRASTSINLAP